MTRRTVTFGLGLLFACSNRSATQAPAPPPTEIRIAAAPGPSTGPTSTTERALAAGGATVVATVEGPRPALFRENGRARVLVGRGAGNPEPVAFDLTPRAERERVFRGGGLTFGGAEAEVVPMLVRPDRAWFSVIERAPAGEDVELRVRLVERDARGLAKVVDHHEVSPGEELRPSLYDRAGKVAVVMLGPSVYAFTRRALVLHGPGTDRQKFEEHDDNDCPPNKRCYPLPPQYDLTKLVGIAPDGSFVTADRGEILRVGPTGSLAYRYETLAFVGVVGNSHVTLAHAGEPPQVVRWSPPPPPRKGPIPPPPAPPGFKEELALGAPAVLGTGPYEALTEDGRSDVYGIRSDGALVKLTGKGAGIVYSPEAGCRATATLGFGEQSVAWVVSCPSPGGTTRHTIATK